MAFQRVECISRDVGIHPLVREPDVELVGDGPDTVYAPGCSLGRQLCLVGIHVPAQRGDAAHRRDADH